MIGNQNLKVKKTGKSSWIARSILSNLLILLLNSCAVVDWASFYVQRSEVVDGKPIPPFEVPKKDPHTRYLSFLVVGDCGTGGYGQKAVARAMAMKAETDSAKFILVLGDNFYEWGVSSVTDPQWQSKFENIYDQPSLQIPFYVVLGNHDYQKNPQAEVEYSQTQKRWRMPSRYFTFTVPIDDTTQVQFFALDTTPMAYLKSAEALSAPDTAGFRVQLHWLENELKNSKARWKIVMGHHTLYSAGRHGNNGMMIRLLEPLFEKYQVDLYLCGHDHSLQLLKPVKNVTYIVSGAGGKHTDVIWNEQVIYAQTNYGFNWCRISPVEILTEFITKTGKLDYAYRIPVNKSN